jgi:hypothetical protein
LLRYVNRFLRYFFRLGEIRGDVTFFEKKVTPKSFDVCSPLGMSRKALARLREQV